MPEQRIDVVLEVRLQLLSAEAGGRPNPVHSGLRPLWRIEGDPPSALGGLCEVELLSVEEVIPGGAADVLLKFARGAIDPDCLTAGSQINLMDGPKLPLGTATVKAIRSHPNG